MKRSALFARLLTLLVLMPALCFGTICQDAFTRADSSTVGANYTHVTNGFGVISNGTYAAASGDNFTFYSAQSFGNDQYAQLVYKTTTNYVGVGVRMSGPTFTGYALYVRPSGAGWDLQRFPGGTTLVSGPSDNFANNDVLKLEISGTTLIVRRNGTSLNGAGTTDANIASGKPGLISYAFSPAAAPEGDDWEGGDSAGGTCGGASTVVNPISGKGGGAAWPITFNRMPAAANDEEFYRLLRAAS